jgi:hypothetical protein
MDGPNQNLKDFRRYQNLTSTGLVLQGAQAEIKLRATGRPKHPVWDFFDDLGRDSRSHRHIARCKYCHAEWQSARVFQLKTHVMVMCEKMDPALRQNFIEHENATKALDKDDEDAYLGPEATEKNTPAKTPSNKKRKVSLGIASMPMPSVGSADEVHELLLRWLITSHTSFEVIDNPYFSKALRSLNSSFISPSQEILLGPLLQREHRLVTARLGHMLSQEHRLSLGLEGWMEPDSTYICAISILFNCKLAFWKMVAVPSCTNTAQVLAGILIVSACYR